MTIRIRRYNPTLATVHITASWLDRLIGRRDLDSVAERRGGEWYWGCPERRAEGRVAEMLNCKP